MKVDFYIANEQLAPTVDNYLFSKECSLVMNGQYIENDDKFYQVTGQTLLDHQQADLAVFLYPVAKRPVMMKD